MVNPKITLELDVRTAELLLQLANQESVRRLLVLLDAGEPITPGSQQHELVKAMYGALGRLLDSMEEIDGK